MRGPRGYRHGSDLQELGIIPDGALLIRNGVVVEAGSTRRLENLAAARGAIEVNAAGRVVMPGFVDSHTHLVFPPPGDGEESAARTVRASTAQRIAARSRAWLLAMARHGTTTVEAKTGCDHKHGAQAKLLRVLRALHGDPLDVIASFQLRLPEGDAAETVEWAIGEFLPAIRKRRLARFADISWDADPAHAECFGRCLRAARNLGLPCKIHVHPACTGAAIRQGVANLAVSIDHWEGAGAADVELMAGAGSMATVMPGAWLRRDGPLPPVRALLDAGVPLALATDFAPQLARSLNMQTVVAMACRWMGMTLEEAISAATVNGAHALGSGGKVGSLEPGNAADLIVLNTSDYRELACHFGANLVFLTMKRGEFIYQEGEVAPLDAADLRAAW